MSTAFGSALCRSFIGKNNVNASYGRLDHLEISSIIWRFGDRHSKCRCDVLVDHYDGIDLRDNYVLNIDMIAEDEFHVTMMDADKYIGYISVLDLTLTSVDDVTVDALITMIFSEIIPME